MRTLPRTVSEIDEADRLADHPHPRENLDLIGQNEPEMALLEAYKSGRMHHAWILAGQGGIGKATLAYRFARYILNHPDPTSQAVQQATSLDIPDNNRIAQIIAAQSHPDVFILRRQWNEKTKKLRTDIQVDETRNLVHMFQSTASAGGWRVAIIDSAEDLNANSANALLKILEEPPPRSIFLIITHEPGRLLPTIRSRARLLSMPSLSEAHVAQLLRELSDNPDESLLLQAAQRSHGSVRRAFALLDGGASGVRSRIENLLAKLPALNNAAVLSIAEECAKRDGTSFERFVETIEDYLHDAVHARKTMSATALMPFAEIAERLSIARRDVDAYNLDRRPLVLSVMAEIAKAML